jgi:hypothetical protein
MQGIIYEEPSAWLFILVTVIMGGAAAWMAGRACAMTWRPSIVLAGYLVILAFGVRFIHMALFGGTLLSLHYYLVDFLVVQAIGALGYRRTRVKQMVAKYGWQYEASGLFGWRRKAMTG